MVKQDTIREEKKKKKDLSSTMDRSRPSKLLEFCSCQIHHIKQCSTNLQITILQWRLKLHVQQSNKSTNPLRHHPTNTKQAKDHTPHLISYRTVKEEMIYRFPTPFAHKTPLKDTTQGGDDLLLCTTRKLFLIYHNFSNKLTSILELILGNIQDKKLVTICTISLLHVG